MALSLTDVTDRDLARDEARIGLILAGGSLRPASPALHPSTLVTGAMMAAVAVGVVAAGVTWRNRAEEAARPTPVASPITVRPIPPVAPAPAATAVPRPLPIAPPLLPPLPLPAGPLPEAKPRAAPARHVAHKAKPRVVAREPAHRSVPARRIEATPARPARSGWINEPLYGEALRRAREVDARRAAELNRLELRGKLPPSGKD